jgi:hypothetical protein
MHYADVLSNSLADCLGALTCKPLHARALGTPSPLTLPVSQVTVIGYPIGGDTMSVTSGVVSRIEVTSYVHGSSELLGVQIDAAINAGNSGADRNCCHRCCCNHAREGCSESFTSPACWVRLQCLR